MATYTKRPPRHRNTSSYAKSQGYRSGFEMQFHTYLQGLECYTRIDFEKDKIKYIIEHTYNPDFTVTTRSGKVIYLETKGFFTSEDRTKHIVVKKQHPDLDIRLVFMKSPYKQRLDPKKKNSASYARWCERNGIMFSPLPKKIPKEWMEE